MIAVWNDPAFTRITVAIEGMRTVSQLWAAWSGFSSVTRAGGSGRVYHAFATFADAIYDSLFAKTNFTNAFARPNVGLTLTGFSLGSAVAEVLAEKFVNTHHGPQYQLAKWASCKVGNADWVNTRRYCADRNNWYVQDDPIWNFPYMTTARIDLRSNPFTQGWTSYALNTPYVTYDLQGGRISNYTPDTIVPYLRSTISAQGALTPNNVWYYHSPDAYRLMLFNDTENNLIAGREASYRFRTLEFDDDNSWLANWTAGMRDYAGLTFLNPTPPADQQYPSAPQDDARLDLQARGHTIEQVPVAGPDHNTTRPPLPRGAWTPRRVRDF